MCGARKDGVERPVPGTAAPFIEFRCQDETNLAFMSS